MKVIQLVISFFIINQFSYAQLFVSPPINIGSSSAYQGYRPKIGLVQDSLPVVAWTKSVTQGLYFSNWNSGSISFNPTSTIFPAGTNFYGNVIDGPEIICSGDTIYIVAWGKTGVNNRIYLTRSFDGGNTFIDTNVVYSTLQRVEFPAITNIADGSLGVAFLKSELDDSFPEILFTKSFDRGLSWSAPTSVSALNPGQPCECCPPDVSSSNNFVAVSYRNNISDIRDFYVGISYDYGNNFNTGIPVDTSNYYIPACPTNGVGSGINGDTLYTVFSTLNGTKLKVKFSATNLVDSTNYNVFFDTVSKTQIHPQLFVANDTMAIVWQQNDGPSYDVYFSWKCNTTSWSAPLNITHTTGHQYTPDVIYKNGFFHVVYYDGAAGIPKYIRIGFTPFPLSVNEIYNEIDHINIFPNPFHDDVYVDFDGDARLYSSSGVHLGNGNSALIKSHLKTLPVGFYLLVTNNKRQYKIVKL